MQSLMTKIAPSVKSTVVALFLGISLGMSSQAEQIEAESYATMEGVSIQAIDANTAVLSDISNNDWARYNIDMALPGTYTLSLHVASGSDFTILAASKDKRVGYSEFSNTGGSEIWNTVSMEVDISSAGERDLTLYFRGSEGIASLFQFDWFSLTPPDPIAIAIGNKRKQQMSYGLDYERLWFWYGPQAALEQVAQWSVVDSDINYLRVAINAGYELVEGQYNLSAYTNKIIPMMRMMQDANPDIKFFASPRPLNEATSNVPWTPYPMWINIYRTNSRSSFVEVKTDKCAEYLIRYIRLMKSYGFKIDYLDLTNEWNEMTSTYMLEIKALMEAELGDDMPKIVAPSAWSYAQGTSWLKSAANRGETDAYDYAAVHYTGKVGEPEDFANEAIRQGKEVWDSELHGWKGADPSTEIPTSIELFNRIRAGFSAMSGWLAIGTTNQGHCYFLTNGTTVTRNVKYYIYNKLSNTSNNGYALDASLPEEFSSTMALVRGNLLTVWVLNNNETNNRINIDIGDFTLSDSTIRQTQWKYGSALEGSQSSFAASPESDIITSVAPNSLYCYEILIEPEAGLEFDRIEAESFDESNGIQTQATTDVDGDLELNALANGDWCRFENLDLGAGSSLRLRVSRTDESPKSRVEIRLNAEDGKLIGLIDIPSTGGSWQTIETYLDPVNGDSSIYLKFVETESSTENALFNLNWIALSTPHSPDAFEALPATDSQIDLSWAAVDNATGYNIKRATRIDGPYTIISEGLNATTFSDTDVSTGKRYYYVSSALYYDAESAHSTEVSAVPSNPILPGEAFLEAFISETENDGETIFFASVPTTEAGHIYQIEYTQSLESPNWQAATEEVLGDGESLGIEIPSDIINPNLFYRLKVMRP